MSLALGSRLGRYRIDSIVGRGGMGTVFRATDLELERPVAIKVLSAEVADDPTFRERFIREAKLLASLDHPSVVPIYEAGDIDGLLFLAMRYVPGRDLSVVLRQEGPLDAERALHVLGQVAQALDAAHAIGLIHRDVKAGNVLVARDHAGREVALLADFGLTRRASAERGLTMTGRLVGSVGAIAPEQLAGRRPDGRSDQYALACLLFECVSGDPPFSGESDAAVLYQHAHAPPPDVRALRSDLPGAFANVLARGMAKDPAMRYASCGALIEAASAALGPPGVTTPARAMTTASHVMTTLRADARAPASAARPKAGPMRRLSPRRLVPALAVGTIVAVTGVVVATMAMAPRPEEASPPAASPLTGRIVFVGGTGRDRELYWIGADGSELTRLTDNDWPEMSPAVSWDGRTIAYAAERHKNKDIYRLGFEATDPSQLTISTDPDDRPAWSPNGQAIAFTRGDEGTDLYLIEDAFLTRGQSEAFTRSDRLTTAPGNEDHPTWAPVGVGLAMSSDEAGGPHIWRHEFESDSWRPVTHGAAVDTSPAWSPDGDWIAFVRTTPDGDADLFRVRPDGTDLERLTHDPAVERAPTWSPDGERLAFCSGDGQDGTLLLLEVKRRAVTALHTGVPYVSDPSWARMPQGDGDRALSPGTT